jgi:hypothetical protein
MDAINVEAAPVQTGENQNTPDNSLKPTEVPVETKQVEVEGTPAKTEPEKIEPVSAKFNALAKKEKVLVQKQEALRTKETTLADREKQIADREAKIKESEALFETDVFAALKLRGYDYNKLTEMFLAGEKVRKEPVDPVVEAKNAVEQLRKEFNEKEAKRIADEKAAAEARVKQEEANLAAAYKRYGEDIEAFTAKNPDDYELINIYSQHSMVLETVKHYFETEGKVLSVKEACDATENYLLNEAKKAEKAKKLQKKIEEAPKIVEKKAEPEAKSKTLTNSMTPQSASVLPAASEADRMKRAMAALTSKG